MRFIQPCSVFPPCRVTGEDSDPVKRHRGERTPSPHLCCAATPSQRQICHDGFGGLRRTAHHSAAPNTAHPKSCSSAGLISELQSLFSFFQHLSNCKELIYCYNCHISSLAMSKQDSILLLSHWNSYTDAALASEGRRTEEALLHHTILVLFSSPLLSAASIHSCSFAEIPATLSANTLWHLPMK